METRCIERIALLGLELEFIRIPASRAGLPTLVFLHEGLGSARLWKSFPSAIAERTGCEAIVYSRAGNGFSSVLQRPHEPAYMHDEALVTLPALLQALEVRKPVVVGHSDGASIALIYAAEHPAAGLVLEAPHLFVESLSVDSIAKIRVAYETTDLRERMGRHHADGDRTFYGWNDVWLSPAFAAWNIEAYAARVNAPVLVLQGAEDQYGTAAQLDALAVNARGSVDRVVLARCGHAPHLDRADLVEPFAAAWIDRTIVQ